MHLSETASEGVKFRERVCYWLRLLWHMISRTFNSHHTVRRHNILEAAVGSSAISMETIELN